MNSLIAQIPNKDMKVLMLGRIGLLEKGGGDKVQIEHTARELGKLGVSVDIKTDLSVDASPYDLVHVFQLDWTPETYFYAKKVKEAGKPLILSPIHHNIKEVKAFDDKFVFDFRRISKLLFKDQHKRDTFKNVYRSLFDRRKLMPTLKSVFIGLEKMHQKTLLMANMVLVQTDLEAKDLQETYKVSFKWVKVPNGVGVQFLHHQNYQNPLGIGDYILCVGRIEPRKNQLTLINVLKELREELGSDIKLVLIGKLPGKQHFEYIYRFKKKLEENPWIVYIQQVPYEQMPSYYHFAKVGVSVSWFESTGLTSLEALFSGTNVVAAGDRAKEYLGGLAYYCRPDDPESIKEALKKALSSPPPLVPENLKSVYTWENAAKKTLEVYKMFYNR